MPPRHDRRSSVMLVASSGGHLMQLLQLRDVWPAEARVWVTFDRPDARSLLAGEAVHHAHHPTNRNAKNLVRNLFLAARLLRRIRPRAVVTTGAGIGVPFCWLGRLAGARVVYVESLTRSEVPSLTARLVQPVAHDVFVQWPELQARLPKSRFEGTVFDLS